MTQAKFDKEEIREGAPFAALSYVLILWILTFIFKKDNPFARLHARQGIVISIGHLACLSFMFIPVIGPFFGFLEIILVIASLYGILLSLTGRTDRIYLVSDIADRLVI